MKHLLLTTIAAVVLVGCGGPSGIHKAAKAGNIEAVKQRLAAGMDVVARDEVESTPFASCDNQRNRRTANRQSCGCECEGPGRCYTDG
jgi:hypothetical protein